MAARDRRKELRELQAARNPFSPPRSYHHQLQPPATASYGSCQPSQSHGIVAVRSAPALLPAASLYAYQAPYQAPRQVPIILRLLCLNPSLRTRTVARVLFTYWASCSPYARLCRDPKLGSRLGMLIHRQKRELGAFRRWRSWSRRRAACDAWLRMRWRVWRRGEAARVQMAQAARERSASQAKVIIRHWRECATGRAWRAWVARSEARASAEQLLVSALERWRRLTRGGAFAHWRATARARAVAWSSALRAMRSWRAHGLSAAWRTWRSQAEASLRRLDAAAAAAAAAARRWRLRDAAVALEAWAAMARSQREARRLSMNSKPNKPVPRRDREGDWRGSGPIRWHRFRAATMVR